MARVPADPAKLVAHHLAAVIAGADVGLHLPEHWQPDTHRPFLLVADDGGSVDWPVSSRHRIRVACFAKGRSTARKTAGTALAELLDGLVPGIAHTSPLASAVLDTRDPHNHAWLAVFTVELVVRTTTTGHHDL